MKEMIHDEKSKCPDLKVQNHAKSENTNSIRYIYISSIYIKDTPFHFVVMIMQQMHVCELYQGFYLSIYFKKGVKCKNISILYLYNIYNRQPY